MNVVHLEKFCGTGHELLLSYRLWATCKARDSQVFLPALNLGTRLKTTYHKLENVNLAINSAKAIGCSVVNIGAQVNLRTVNIGAQANLRRVSTLACRSTWELSVSLFRRRSLVRPGLCSLRSWRICTGNPACQLDNSPPTHRKYENVNPAINSAGHRFLGRQRWRSGPLSSQGFGRSTSVNNELDAPPASRRQHRRTGSISSAKTHNLWTVFQSKLLLVYFDITIEDRSV